MDKEVWPAVYAMADSIRSILYDTDKSDLDKETLLKTSASEFATALSSYAGSWASGKRWWAIWVCCFPSGNAG